MALRFLMGYGDVPGLWPGEEESDSTKVTNTRPVLKEFVYVTYSTSHPWSCYTSVKVLPEHREGSRPFLLVE